MAATEPLTTDHDRLDIALRSSWEIEGCTAMALALLNRPDQRYTTQWEATIRALLIRSHALSSTIMSALNDDAVSTFVLREQLAEGG